MDDEEGGDRDYFDLCWIIGNDEAVRSQKSAYAFEQTNLKPLSDFAPNEAVWKRRAIINPLWLLTIDLND